MGNVTLDRQIAARLTERGVRYTKGRRRVVGALAEADGPRSAAELHGDLGAEVPLSSLYRSLGVLEDAEVLAPHHGARGLVRYELAEWLTGHHHHLVCLDCGAVDDVHLAGDLESRLEGVVGEVTGDASFRATGHALEIEGRCSRCR